METLRRIVCKQNINVECSECCDLVLPLGSRDVGCGLVFKDIFHQPRAACSLQCEEVCDHGKQALNPGHRTLILPLPLGWDLYSGNHKQNQVVCRVDSYSPF